jgi:hypothetical protein
VTARPVSNDLHEQLRNFASGERLDILPLNLTGRLAKRPIVVLSLSGRQSEILILRILSNFVADASSSITLPIEQYNWSPSLVKKGRCEKL